MFATTTAYPRRATVPGLELERAISAVATTFVSVPPDAVDQAIRDSQQRIGNVLGVDRSSLLQMASDGELKVTHAWTRAEFADLRHDTSRGVSPLFPWLVTRLRAGQDVVLDSLDAVACDADRAMLQRLGVKSGVYVPLRCGGEFFGAVTFESLRHERATSPAVLDRVRLLGSIFTQALQQRRSHQALQDSLAEVTRLRQLLTRDHELLHLEVNAHSHPGTFTSDSVAMREVLTLIDDVAPTNATVLLLGETGSGKEVLAKQIHMRSPRHKRPMVSINCAALPAALIESELFGRERGAYTGAISRQKGRFELADGSTIFLDEIGDLPLDMQVKLLRVVECQEVDRLGGTHPLKVDVRIIAATNRNLEAAVLAGTFREDLFYRLNVFPLTVPPLRERPEDIPSLVWSFVEEFAARFNKPVTSVSRDGLEALAAYPWPGNVRELRNLVEHAVILARGPHLEIWPRASRVAATSTATSTKLADIEAAHIRSVLERTRWRVRGRGGAADLLGLKPTTLEGRMSRMGLQRPTH